MTRPEEPEPNEANDQFALIADLDHAPEVTDPDVTDPDQTGPDQTGRVEPAAPANDAQAGSSDVPGPAAGSRNGSPSDVTVVTTGAPPVQQVETTVADEQPPAVTLQAGQPEQPRTVEQPKAAPRSVGPAYGYSPSSAPAPPAGPRYGRPVAQPSNTQSSRGPGQNFSQPTVRIGGRVQPEQAAPQPPSARVRPTRVPRRASLQLRYLEPWSVLKVSLVLSVAGFLAWMVAVGVLYSILGGMGVWDQLNGTYSDLTSVSDPQASEDLISAGGVFGVAALVGMVNIVLITAMCTVGAFIYNASADLAGGIEVTLSERD